MLQLPSTRWAELTHAYGEASDIEEFLTRLATGDETAIEDLSGSLVHQNSVYSASYAAVPHLVDIARRLDDPDLKANTLILVGQIASSSDFRSNTGLAPDIDTAYRAALPEALKLAIATLQLAFEPYDAVYLLQTAAWLNGFETVGLALAGFLDDEFTFPCPRCKRDLYVWPEEDEDEDGYTTAGEDPLQSPMTPRTALLPGPAAGSTLDAQYRWLLEFGGESALSVIGERLPYLFGKGECPVCEAPFTLLDQLSTVTEER